MTPNYLSLNFSTSIVRRRIILSRSPKAIYPMKGKRRKKFFLIFSRSLNVFDNSKKQEDSWKKKRKKIRKMKENPFHGKI